MTSAMQPIGPLDAKILIVGEAPGQQEKLLGIPFVGASGSELTKMLKEAGINRDDCFLTNVFNEQPFAGNVENFCTKRLEASTQYQAMLLSGEVTVGDAWPAVYNWPPLKMGKYVEPQYLHNLIRLKTEIETVRPNLIIALGNVACWALLGTGGIMKIRGTIAESSLVPGVKVLPTYHPAQILRQWDLRAIAVLDLVKARKEAVRPEIIRPSRQIWINPSLADLDDFHARYIEGSKLLAVDIETMRGQIDCIGFAPSKTECVVVPFIKAGKHYWPTVEDEVSAMRWCRKVLQSNIPKVFQNGMYDLQWIWKKWRCPVKAATHDTMLLHHSLQPELQKGLGFLGSIYTLEQSWKIMREHKADVEKKDE